MNLGIWLNNIIVGELYYQMQFRYMSFLYLRFINCLSWDSYEKKLKLNFLKE